MVKLFGVVANDGAGDGYVVGTLKLAGGQGVSGMVIVVERPTNWWSHRQKNPLL